MNSAKIFKVSAYLFLMLLLPFLVHAQCTAGFNYASTGASVSFTSTASGNFTLINYDYGDGNFDNGVTNPTHVYAQEGVYIVCQFIQDLNGNCFDLFCDTVFTENGTCSADFDWFANGLSLDLLNASLGAYDSTTWSFGDGNVSTANSPTHTYNAPGIYNVCLSIFDQGTLCDSICETIDIDTAVGGVCAADFTSSTAGLTVLFSNLSSGDYNAQFWDFGDFIGNSTDNNPTYTYQTAGTYEVCLLVLDTNGGNCFDQYCMDVTVTGGGGGGGPCTADFSYETSALTIDVENESSGLFLTSLWDYGDGGLPSFDESYTYEEAGEYEVCLTILNPFPFCTDVYCDVVEIVDLNCEASFEYSFDPATNAYSFYNTTTVGNVTSVEWEFGDGNSSTFASPTYAYNTPGVYEVCLYTYDGDDLCGIACEEVEVYPLGINERENNLLKVFPNPSEGIITLAGLPKSGSTLIIRDLAGRVVFQMASESENMRIELDLASGSYLLEVLSHEEGVLAYERIILER